MTGELDDIADELRSIEERLRDLAYERLRIAAEEGDDAAAGEEKRLLAARRALERAIRELDRARGEPTETAQ